MRVHWLQHVAFEGLGYLDQWARERGATLSCTKLYAGEPLPDLDQFDWLIVMGGPMNILDEANHPWLRPEKKFILDAIQAEKRVLGICLGAQLMAHVLGADVYPGPTKEIGWFPIKRAAEAPSLLPESLTVFHWHGDTFEIPLGAQLLASSEPGINQGFCYGARAIGLQFHLETTPDSMAALISHCGEELNEDAPFIQTEPEMLQLASEHSARIHQVIDQLLDALADA